jgi:hypothetical protein
MSYVWLAALRRGPVAGLVRFDRLLGQYQFVAAGNSQAVLFTCTLYDDFLSGAKKLRAGDAAFPEVDCLTLYMEFHKLALS